MMQRIWIAILALAVVFLWTTQNTQAHGSMEDPISRVYNCYLEGPESPVSAACQAAVALSGPQHLYDWNGINQLPNGDHQAFVPDGQFSHFHQFLQPSLLAIEPIFQRLVDIVADMGLAAISPKIIEINQQFA